MSFTNQSERNVRKQSVVEGIHPFKTKYTLHWLSPEGENCLLGGSNNLEEMNRIGIEQVQELMDNPWETDQRRYLFLKNIEVIDEETGELVDDMRLAEFEDYVDGLLSELSSRR